MRFLILLLALFAALPAQAATKKLNSFGAWQTFHLTEGGQDVCYMVQRPAKTSFAPGVEAKPKKGKAKPEAKRGAPALLITLRPTEGLNPVVSYDAGYIFKPQSEAVLQIGKTKFTMFTDKASAWARSGAIDRAITNAILKSKTVNVAGRSAKGGKSLDVFDVKGADKAYAAIAKNCGLH